MNTVFVLLHSPLVGPLTWAPVSRELRQRGIETVLPVLTDDGVGSVPFWAQHAAAVALRLEPLAADRRVMLVGHSGAGPILPAAGAFSPHPVIGYIFVDAGLPHPGISHLEEIEAGSPDFGRELRQELTAGGSFPQWTDEDLRDILPDVGIRQSVLAKLQPRGLTFFEEPMPYYGDWPAAPCAYVKFSDAYAGAAQQAQWDGWPYREFDAGHFHMLVDPRAVAEALLELTSTMS